LTDLNSQIDEKMENLENNLINFIGPNSRKLEAIQKEFDLTRYKILVSVDAKLKALEGRLMEKVENVEKSLDIKLEKIMKVLNVGN